MLCLSIQSSCTDYKEVAPFTDGLILEYELLSNKTIYAFQALENSEYKITETRKRGILGDDIEELIVDTYGRVYKSSFKDYEGKFSKVWIPVNKLKIGDSFDGGYTVLRKDNWKKWKVLVIKNPIFDEERYFELKTGYFVGAFTKTSAGAGETVLIKSNAEVPIIE